MPGIGRYLINHSARGRDRALPYQPQRPRYPTESRWPLTMGALAGWNRTDGAAPCPRPLNQSYFSELGLATRKPPTYQWPQYQMSAKGSRRSCLLTHASDMHRQRVWVGSRAYRNAWRTGRRGRAKSKRAQAQGHVDQPLAPRECCRKEDHRVSLLYLG